MDEESIAENSTRRQPVFQALRYELHLMLSIAYSSPSPYHQKHGRLVPGSRALLGAKMLKRLSEHAH
jgi:hypothetical protein